MCNGNCWCQQFSTIFNKVPKFCSNLTWQSKHVCGQRPARKQPQKWQDAAREEQKRQYQQLVQIFWHFFTELCPSPTRFLYFCSRNPWIQMSALKSLWCSVVASSSAWYPFGLFPRRTDSNSRIWCIYCSLDWYARELSKYHLCYCSLLAICQISLNYGSTIIQLFGPLFRG